VASSLLWKISRYSTSRWPNSDAGRPAATVRQLQRTGKATSGLGRRSLVQAPLSGQSPAGAAPATELPDDLARAYEVTASTLSPAALAYVRARGADPKSSYGDLAALSDPVDQPTATFLKGVVSDGIIAPIYCPDVLKLLKTRTRGAVVHALGCRVAVSTCTRRRG
jgi:AICAR transformylase/IMP cyclohydrolase PurH